MRPNWRLLSMFILVLLQCNLYCRSKFVYCYCLVWGFFHWTLGSFPYET